jgi:flagellar hook-associated protein 3 FlgL
MQVAQTAMTQIQQIASSVYAQLPNLNGLNPSEVDSIATQARDALQQVAGLLNAQDGGVYVFSGQDTANPPVPDPSGILSSGFMTQIGAAVANLGSAGAAATATAVQQVASLTSPGSSPFSAYLSNASVSLPRVQTGPNQTEPYGFLATANTASPSTGTYSTGSYMRDLMGALATIGSLSSSQINLSGFQALVQETTTTLQGAIGSMAEDAGIVGNRQTALTALQSNLSATQTALTSQVSNVQDADMAKTLSSLTTVQTQLEASYQVIANLGTLSLAKFLPA